MAPSTATRDEVRRRGEVFATFETQDSGHVSLVDHVDAEDGAILVQPWFDGELLRAPAGHRNEPTEAFARFRALPASEIVAALDLHVFLEEAGWLAGDLYDGSLMHDFAAGRTVVVDLECYRRGPFVNEVGRLPGSTRFMAPEEHEHGATICWRTTVFTLGRVLDVFLPATDRSPTVAAPLTHATQSDPSRRPPSVAALADEWGTAVGMPRGRQAACR